jgi:hypothetical protein
MQRRCAQQLYRRGGRGGAVMQLRHVPGVGRSPMFELMSAHTPVTSRMAARSANTEQSRSLRWWCMNRLTRERTVW